MPPGSRPACLSQSKSWAVESTWSSYFAAGEDRQLVQVFGAPAGLLGEVDKAVLDYRGLGVHAHDLVGLRLVAGDGVQAQLDQFLDQLGPRGLVLDQHDTGIEGFGLRAYRALQFRIFHALAQYMQQIEVLAGDAPGGADAEIAELGRLVGGVPALHDAVEEDGPLTGRVSPEPRRLDHAAALGCGHLLVLAGEIILADRPADLLEHGGRLALGMQGLAL